MEEINLVTTNDNTTAGIVKCMAASDLMGVKGVYTAQCFDKDGNLKWEDTIENLVTDEGKKFTLDLIFGTGSYTAAYMGLISSVGYTTIIGGDTAAQINGSNGWKEAGSSTNYPIIANRGTPAWSAASGSGTVSKATSSAVSFSIITTGGTVKGAIIVINGTTAVANTTGKLYSAGLFTGGDKVVAVSDTLNVSYTTSLT
jgi:hypothetical protein